MAKYVIEIEDEPFGRNDDPVIPHGMDELYRARGFKSLVFDQNGLDKLTPYTEPDEDESYDTSRYKSIGLAFLKWLGSDAGDKLKSSYDVYEFLDKNCYNKDSVEQEVWEFVKILGSMSQYQRKEMFGDMAYWYVLDTFNYQQAKAKYESWQKRKDEIRVGDEVEAESGNKACVFYENPDGTMMFVFKPDGTATWWSKRAIHKTGKNFPEVAELLKKMRKESDD